MPQNTDSWLPPAAKIISEFEGFEKPIGTTGNYAAYKCPAGIWTIGKGSTGPDIKRGTIWTKAQCEARFLRDLLDRFGPAVDKLTEGIAVTANQKAALVSFAYNLGEERLEESTLLRKLRDGNIAGAADEFLRWTFAGGKQLKGLIRRREAERKLFLGIPRP